MSENNHCDSVNTLFKMSEEEKEKICYEMYEYEKYTCDKHSLKETLERYGVAIIPSLLTDVECEEMVSGMWDYFEHISAGWETPLLRTDENTWRKFYDLYPKHSMLIQHFSVGHAAVSWNLRQKEKIVDIFSTFWDTRPEELLVSFDGLSFHLPPEVTKKGWNKNHKWLHTDQSFVNSKFLCVQSWITGLDVNEGDATLAFLEKSHLYHQDLQKEFKITSKDDWYKISEEEEKFYLNKGCEYKKIKCPKGSLVLWDSRTMHSGSEALKSRETPNLRSIVYLCYMPRKLCSKANLEKKKKAFLELRTTNHWASKPKLFPKTPRTYGASVPKINPISPPQLTELGKSLAGF
jgi:hypothetical protein